VIVTREWLIVEGDAADFEEMEISDISECDKCGGRDSENVKVYKLPQSIFFDHFDPLVTDDLIT
jgi:hypothetical protein